MHEHTCKSLRISTHRIDVSLVTSIPAHTESWTTHSSTHQHESPVHSPHQHNYQPWYQHSHQQCHCNNTARNTATHDTQTSPHLSVNRNDNAINTSTTRSVVHCQCNNLINDKALDDVGNCSSSQCFAIKASMWYTASTKAVIFVGVQCRQCNTSNEILMHLPYTDRRIW
jgi:hypothetical protein